MPYDRLSAFNKLTAEDIVKRAAELDLSCFALSVIRPKG